jgi:hypothetical protein
MHELRTISCTKDEADSASEYNACFESLNRELQLNFFDRNQNRIQEISAFRQELAHSGIPVIARCHSSNQTRGFIQLQEEG